MHKTGFWIMMQSRLRNIRTGGLSGAEATTLQPHSHPQISHEERRGGQHAGAIRGGCVRAVDDCNATSWQKIDKPQSALPSAYFFLRAMRLT